MEELGPGLYEVLVTEGLRARVDAIAGQLTPSERALAPAEAPDRIAWHLGREIERTLRGIGDGDRVAVGIKLARDLIDWLGESLDADPTSRPVDPGVILHALAGLLPDGSVAAPAEPLTPLLDTTLLTNAPGEPALGKQIRSEIDSADSIDMIMAFIRRTGLRPMLDNLRRHCEQGRELRILTTTYTGSTEQAALDELADLGAQIRVSYDRSSTRLHAKAWIFHRNSGFSTAYVGSSNLTYSAHQTGVEWNFRASGARNPDVLDKFRAVFESYWASDDYLDYEPGQFADEIAVARGPSPIAGPTVILSPIELRPYPFQERLLELLAVARRQGHHRNLLVAAMGTGKTVMAAVDYARLQQTLPRARLLFVAHRREILDQSIATFRHALRDASFGEKWVGGERPTRFDHVFASVQSLNAAGLDALDPEHFDVVIIDEFHHAAAASYQHLLDHLQPQELLGLTATPERADGLPVLGWFDGRIAAELRVWDAIDQQHLSPFHYFGIHDGSDLRDIPWKRGLGYEIAALTDCYTSTDAWARLVIQQVLDHVDASTMRCLGFCVSVEHAEFMADHFNRHGIPCVAVSAATPQLERARALKSLGDGEVRAVFSVDLFNEGVDVPNVDTVLMLRPTQSPVLFLQQLGRGLRRSPDKPFCTVLDFVGNHRTEFRFDRRYQALLGGTRRHVEEAVKNGFPYLPSGCDMQLDPMATDVVLRSLRQAIPSQWPAKVEELRVLREQQRDVTLADYLADSGLELEDVYAGNRAWSDLCEAAGVPVLPAGPEEVPLRRAVGRMLHVDDYERIGSWQALIHQDRPPVVNQLAERERRLLHMLTVTLTDQALKSTAGSALLQDGVDLLWRHPQVLAEVSQLLDVLEGRIDHVHEPLMIRPDAPLQVHARYSRLEIMAAMGRGDGKTRVGSWQSGVYQDKASNAELLAFTLDKTGSTFSPTTRYRDYAISRELIHWESQSTTRADGETGRRYRNHQSDGRAILLFARLSPADRSFWFLGPATYQRHVGERPMAVTWKLDVPLSGDLYTSFAAAVA